MPRKLQKPFFCSIFFENIFSKFKTLKLDQFTSLNFRTFVLNNAYACIFLLIAICFALINVLYIFFSSNQVDSGVAARQNSQQILQLANQLITNTTWRKLIYIAMAIQINKHY